MRGQSTTSRLRGQRSELTAQGYCTNAVCLSSPLHPPPSPLHPPPSRRVLAELSKIQRFDAVLSGKGGGVEEEGGEGVIGEEGRGEGVISVGGKSSVPHFVQEALKRTTEAVKDIDTILRH